MATNDQDQVIVDEEADTNEEVEVVEEAPKQEKPKRTPQEEYDYHNGRAQRLAKKLGLEAKPEVKEDSSKPSDLDMGSIAYLAQMTGLKGKAEIALAREYLANGKTVLDLPDNKFFIQDLQSLRDSAETANAVPKGKGRSSQSAVTDIDLAVAKFKEDGTLPKDFDTRNKVVDIVTKLEKGVLFGG